MILTKNCTKRVNITYSFKPFFTVLLLDLNIGQKMKRLVENIRNIAR